MMLANMDSMVIKPATIFAQTHTHTLGGGPPSKCRHAEHSGEYKHGNACVQPHPCTSRTGLKTHKCSHTVHTYCTCGHTNRLAKRTHSRWHWGVTVKCKPSDYSLRRWEERGGDRSGGVLKRGQRRRRRDEKRKKKARAINMHKA